MEDIIISCLVPDYHFDDGATGSGVQKTQYYCAGSGGTTRRNSSGTPERIISGINQKVQILRIAQGETPSTRIVGLKTGTNPDGSIKVKLLANNVNYLTSRKFYSYGIIGGRYNTNPIHITGTDNYSCGLTSILYPNRAYYTIGSNSRCDVYYAGSISQNATMTNSDATILSMDGIEELPNLSSYSTLGNPCLIESNSSLGSTIDSNKNISTDVNNTIEFNIKSWAENIVPQTNITIGGIYIDEYLYKEYGDRINPLVGFTGKNYEYECTLASKIEGLANSQPKNSGLTSRDTVFFPDSSTLILPENFYYGTNYMNLHITSSYDRAIEYLNTGKVPKDDEYYPANADNPSPYDGEPQPTPPTRPETQIGNEDNDIPEHTTRATYGTTSSNNLTGINWYYIHKSILESFINWFWNDMTDWSSILMNWVTGLYGDLQNAIISLKKIHVADKFLLEDVDDGGRHYTTEIKLARFTCSLPNSANYLQSLDSELHGLKYVGGVNFLENKDIYSFLTYAPYRNVSIYLPYVGIVPLDTRYLHPNDGQDSLTVNIACGASYMTGEIVYRVQMGDCDVAYYQGKCSEDVPFSMNSAMQLATNTVNAIGNVSAGLIGGGVGVATTQLLGQNIASPTNTNSSITSTLNKYLGSKCAIIIQQPQYFKVYDTEQDLKVSDYGKSKGFKFNCVRTFKSGDGYTEFVNPHINNWETAPTETEIQEIYSLMESGIVL